MTDTATATAADTAADTEAAGRYATFRERRQQSVTMPTGPLALVNTQWVDESQTIWGVPGTWAPLPDGESGLLLTAAADDGIRVNGELVDGTVSIAGKDAPEPGAIVFDEQTIGTVIRGEDGMYALRVWDAQSEYIREFGAVDAYE